MNFETSDKKTVQYMNISFFVTLSNFIVEYLGIKSPDYLWWFSENVVDNVFNPAWLLFWNVVVMWTKIQDAVFSYGFMCLS